MSKNRENVIWQSADGTWGRGFFETYATKDWSDDDYDDEWDVDYHYDTFSWVSVGHPTEQSALASWDGANPGGCTSYEYGQGEWPEDPPVASKFDEMAVACAASGWYARGVSPTAVADYKDRAAISRFYFTQRSYDPKTKKMSDYFASSDAEERKAITALLTRRPELAAYARECRQKVMEVGEQRIEEAREQNRRDARWGGRSTRVTDAMARAEAELEFIDKVKIPAAPKKAAVSASPDRRKTTAASTAGSFAPKTGAAPEVRLSPAPPDYSGTFV